MAPVHISLLPHVQDAGELYDLLGHLQTSAKASVGWRALVTVALLAGGFVLPGPAGMAAFCMSAVGGLAAVGAMADFVARGVLMDVVTLQEVIRPRAEPAELLAYQLAQLLANDDAGDQQEVH